MKTFFVVDVSMNWATNRNWQIKVLDTWKVTQLNLPRQESAKYCCLRFFILAVYLLMNILSAVQKSNRFLAEIILVGKLLVKSSLL